jgi:hypothetical protein
MLIAAGMDEFEPGRSYEQWPVKHGLRQSLFVACTCAALARRIAAVRTVEDIMFGQYMRAREYEYKEGA